MKHKNHRLKGERLAANVELFRAHSEAEFRLLEKHLRDERGWVRVETSEWYVVYRLPTYGSWLGHALTAAITYPATYGLGNVAYGAWKKNRAPRAIIKMEGDLRVPESL